MPHFGAKSTEKLITCHSDLIRIAREAIRWFDFSVIHGHRGEAEQNELYPRYSKKRWPESRHNSYPSDAFDLAPYPTDWTDEGSFILLAGAILCVARQMGIGLRYGGDWNRDDRIADTGFRDLGHFELVRPA